MNFAGLVFHSLSIISVFKKEVIVRSIVFFLGYLFLIYKNMSILTILPEFFLLAFVFIILKLSMRENMEEFNKSLENIGSIDILNNSNSR